MSAVPEKYYAELQEAGISVEEANKYYMVFKMFDKDNSESMDAGELFACLQVMGQAPKSKDEVKQLLKTYDKDASGTMEFVEFARLMGHVCKPAQTVRDDLMTSFQKLDKDHSGYIEREELHEAIFGSGQSTMTEKEFDKLMKEADANGDGKIDYAEFLNTLLVDISKLIETKKQKLSSGKHKDGEHGGDKHKKDGEHGGDKHKKDGEHGGDKHKKDGEHGGDKHKKDGEHGGDKHKDGEHGGDKHKKDGEHGGDKHKKDGTKSKGHKKRSHSGGSGRSSRRSSQGSVQSQLSSLKSQVMDLVEHVEFS